MKIEILNAINSFLESIPTLLAVGSQPIVLIVIFWILLLLWVLSAWAPLDNVNYIRGGKVIVAILLGILGYCTFGFS